MPWKRILALLTALLLLGLLLALQRPRPLLVDAGEVIAGPLRVTIDDQGETRSKGRFLLAAPVAGRLMRIELRDGDAVAQGQVLAQIAPLPLSERERDEIKARVAAAEAVQREAELRARLAREDLLQAQRQLERQQKLAREGYLSPQAAELASNLVVTASLAVEAAQARERAAAADVRVAQSGLGVDGLVQVRAPVASRVLRIQDPSERVVPAGSPLLTLGEVDRLEVVIDLLSTDAVKVRAGMPVLVEGWGDDKVLRATVRRVEPFAVTKMSALGIEEKRTNVVADFVDPPGSLGDGFRIRAKVVIWQSDRVLKLPSNALFSCREEGGWCVFVIDAGRARRRPVMIGHRNPQEAEVLKGIEAGRWVVSYPGNQLQDGARVDVRQPMPDSHETR